MLPWRLAAPISREVVAPGARARDLLILGGLDASGSSASGVYVLDTRTGRLSAQGSLLQATHDAAGAVLGGRVLVVGGGTTAPTSSTQIEAHGRTVAGGALPQARADASAVTIGDTAYLVGGYDGPAMDRQVLATNDGRIYRGVASLAVPVRYPAVAALGARIYIFGGLDQSGHPVRAVQLVEPGSHTAKVVGSLPAPLAAAAAGVLGRTIYLVGGVTPAGAPSRRVYAYDPQSRAFSRAASLRVAVGNAGAAVSGGRLWIVGGETAGGRPTAAVQVVGVAPRRS
jgi:N-acetylneuraminic acid mutarotase